MSHNFVSGDVVRIGKGTVEYDVEKVEGDNITVRGGKANRAQTVEASRLTLVKAVFANVDGSQDIGEEIAEGVYGPVAEENVISLSTHNHMAPALPAAGIFLLIDAEEPVEYKSFDAAAFALSRNHTYYVATIVKDRAVTVQRKRVIA